MKVTNNSFYNIPSVITSTLSSVRSFVVTRTVFIYASIPFSLPPSFRSHIITLSRPLGLASVTALVGSAVYYLFYRRQDSLQPAIPASLEESGDFLLNSLPKTPEELAEITDSLPLVSGGAAQAIVPSAISIPYNQSFFFLLTPELLEIILCESGLSHQDMLAASEAYPELNAVIENYRCTIDLSNQRLTDFPVVTRPTNIRLRLVNNRIRDIPAPTGDLSRFQELDLSTNYFISLPLCIYTCTSLVKLSLFNNQLTAIDDSIGQLTKLQYLRLSQNDLGVFPPVITLLKQLKTLGLSENSIESIPDSIGELSNLEALGLHGNLLGSIPDSICELASLGVLDLSFNKLTTLPKHFGKLKNLEILELQGNLLSSLPDSICELASLRELDLCGNELTTLPKLFSELINLRRCNLAGNCLEELPASLSSLSKLFQLTISGAAIQDLHTLGLSCHCNIVWLTKEDVKDTLLREKKCLYVKQRLREMSRLLANLRS